MERRPWGEIPRKGCLTAQEADLKHEATHNTRRMTIKLKYTLILCNQNFFCFAFDDCHPKYYVISVLWRSRGPETTTTTLALGATRGEGAYVSGLKRRVVSFQDKNAVVLTYARFFYIPLKNSAEPDISSVDSRTLESSVLELELELELELAWILKFGLIQTIGQYHYH